jgi:hypothetical protein
LEEQQQQMNLVRRCLASRRVQQQVSSSSGWRMGEACRASALVRLDLAMLIWIRLLHVLHLALAGMRQIAWLCRALSLARQQQLS